MQFDKKNIFLGNSTMFEQRDSSIQRGRYVNISDKCTSFGLETRKYEVQVKAWQTNGTGEYLVLSKVYTTLEGRPENSNKRSEIHLQIIIRMICGYPERSKQSFEIKIIEEMKSEC